MKKFLTSALLSSVLALAFLSGCFSTPEEKLEKLKKELEELRAKEGDIFRGKMSKEEKEKLDEEQKRVDNEIEKLEAEIKASKEAKQ